jgi:ribosomal protein L16 Arg81 hydroxylase
MSTALQSLLGMEGAASFLAGPWPQRHLAVHRDLATLPALLRTGELASLDALAARYRGPVVFGRGALDARTASADEHAGKLFRLGLSVYLADLGAQVPGLQAWLLALERELGLPPACSSIGAFASPRGDGVACHFDADDVISIQLKGRKVFHLAPVADLPYPLGRQFGPGMLPGEELYAQASAGFPDPAHAQFERIEMAAGSVLFMPRGTWHRTEALDDSFSVSIGIRAPAALERVLGQMRELLLQDPRWRRPLYEAYRPGRNGDDLVGQADALLGELPGVIRQLSGLDLVRPELAAARRERYQRVPMARLEHLPRTDRLRLKVWARDEAWNEHTTLDTEAPGRLAPALDWLKERCAAFDVQDLGRHCPALAEGDRRQLLELLAQAGYLRRLSYPASLSVPTLAGNGGT